MTQETILGFVAQRRWLDGQISAGLDQLYPVGSHVQFAWGRGIAFGTVAGPADAEGVLIGLSPSGRLMRLDADHPDLGLLQVAEAAHD